MNERSPRGLMRRAWATAAHRLGLREDRGHNRAGRRRSRRIGRARNQRGVTVIEIMVSVVVLAIVIAPMFDAFVRGRVMVAHRGEERCALRLVERKVEQLLAAGGAMTGSDADITSTHMAAGTHPINSTITLITRGDLDTSNDVIGDLTWDVTSVTWSDAGGSWDDATYKHVVAKLAWPQGAHRDSVSVITIIN